MATLNKADSSSIQTIIKLVDVTGNTATQIENTFNNSWGSIGWRFVQAIIIGAKTYVIIEKQG